jgi:hypothetical protein
LWEKKTLSARFLEHKFSLEFPPLCRQTPTAEQNSFIAKEALQPPNVKNLCGRAESGSHYISFELPIILCFVRFPSVLVYRSQLDRTPTMKALCTNRGWMENSWKILFAWKGWLDGWMDGMYV